MKILISAGHNPGTDSGAVGQGQYEADDNVRMCDRIVYYLNTWGIDTIYMPNNVGDLQAEINWANANISEGQGYAIQIHRNAGGGTGNEVWTTDYLNQIPLATSILNSMTEMTGLRSRGVKDIKTSNWPLGWINYVNAESVLVEARFMDVDSITDADDYLDAYSIAVGIARFLGVAYGYSLEAPKPPVIEPPVVVVPPVVIPPVEPEPIVVEEPPVELEPISEPTTPVLENPPLLEKRRIDLIIEYIIKLIKKVFHI